MTYLNYIAGDWVEGDELAQNVNPSDLSDTIGEASLAGSDLTNRALEVTAETADSWANSGTELRADILDKVGTKLIDNREAFGRLLSREQGKVLAEGIGEVVRAGRLFKFFAAEAVRLTGQCGPSIRQGLDVRVDRFPVGPVGLITPWNFPIAIPAWKLAPALAFGNTVTLKPAELTPACADLLAKLLDEAGLPKGVFNLVHGRGATTGDAIVRSPLVKALSFTGSERVGKYIRLASAETNKAIQLELGGKNPLVIADDADIDRAVQVALSGSYGGSGQKCTASSRIIVMKAVHNTFVDKLLKGMRALRTGHALQDGVDLGPVADKSQFETVRGFIDRAIASGADVVTGNAPDTSHEGHYVEPALILNAAPDAESSVEEIFGPCASVFSVDTLDEAITMANNTRFGLSSGLCTTSLARADKFRREIKTGLTMINVPTAGVDYHVPFGGSKESSHGPKEQGEAAIAFYTRTKTTYTAF